MHVAPSPPAPHAHAQRKRLSVQRGHGTGPVECTGCIIHLLLCGGRACLCSRPSCTHEHACKGGTLALRHPSSHTPLTPLTPYTPHTPHQASVQLVLMLTPAPPGLLHLSRHVHPTGRHTWRTAASTAPVSIDTVGSCSLRACPHAFPLLLCPVCSVLLSLAPHDPGTQTNQLNPHVGNPHDDTHSATLPAAARAATERPMAITAPEHIHAHTHPHTRVHTLLTDTHSATMPAAARAAKERPMAVTAPEHIHAHTHPRTRARTLLTDTHSATMPAAARAATERSMAVTAPEQWAQLAVCCAWRSSTCGASWAGTCPGSCCLSWA